MKLLLVRLTNTYFVSDLSDNRLSELPSFIYQLGSMETLRVRSTGLRTLPNTFYTLSSLTYLDLRFFHLFHS